MEGPWAGWSLATGDPFNAHAGPFYHRFEEGAVVCAMEVGPQHLNGGGAMHGGALATFADFTLFAIADMMGDEAAVTVSLSSDYVGAANPGDRIEGRGEVIRRTGSMIFIRGLLTRGSEPVMSFTGILKRLRPRG